MVPNNEKKKFQLAMSDMGDSEYNTGRIREERELEHRASTNICFHPQTVPHSAPASVENTAQAGVTVEKAIEMQKQQPLDDVDENCQRNSEKPDLPEGAPPQSIDANNSASQVK